jgi:hypothetical protein
VLRANLKWKLGSQLVGSCLALMLTIGISSCEQSLPATDNLSMTQSTALTATDGPLAEVNTPASISQLAPSLEKYQPQVQILSPKPDEILSDDRVTVKLKVSDLPLFKQPELGLGNYLHMILDKQTYREVYDLSQPLVFKNLAAGTHSLRVFASRPWHESFKNEGAFDQVTFHVLTKTAENNPAPQQPLLTYSRPAGTYSAEPIMLDYYLTNAPSLPAKSGIPESLPNWRVRVTVNDQRFILDRWAPVYLQGFKEGKNWVRLELVDDSGHPLPNVYNDTFGIVTYDPRTKDPLAKLIRGELSPNLARTLVDPDIVAIQSSPLPTRTPSIDSAPASTPTPIPAPIAPRPIAIAPIPIVKPSTSPVVKKPAPIVKTLPSPVSEPNQIPVDRHDRRAADSIKTNPTVTPTLVQPTILPTPAPTPIVIVPVPATELKRPVPVAQPSPVQLPAPEVAKTPPHPNSEPIKILIPDPSLPPTATGVPSAIAIVPPQITGADDLTKPRLPKPEQPQSPAPATTPSVPTPLPQNKQPEPNPSQLIPPTDPTLPVAAGKSETTWQTKTIELFDLAKSKIRTFTNTIPSKAHRFGHNVQIWADKAIDLIQQLRDRR